MIYLFLHNRRDEKRGNAVSGIEAKVRSGIVRSGSGEEGSLCEDAAH
jgi:hypothetical protein